MPRRQEQHVGSHKRMREVEMEPRRILAAIMAASLLAVCGGYAMADRVSFAEDRIGAAPKGWTATLTGKGQPKWTVDEDPTAPSKSKVVKQSGRATYPILLKEGTVLKDGAVEVQFKAISGSEDRAAGLIWRAKDANNYYVVRANALEDNVVLYKTVEGKRSSLDIVGRKGGYGMKVSVPANRWHTLRVEFQGRRFNVIFNGKRLFQVQDDTFTEPGMVGIWTEADSETVFDDFSFEMKN
jgi:hypothetical protein